MSSTPPSSSSPTERPLTFVFAALWAICAVLVVAIGTGIAEALRPGAVNDIVTVTAAYVVGYSFVLFAILRVHEPESRIRDVLALRWPGVVVALLAIVVGAALSPAADHVQSLLPEEPASESVEKLFAAHTVGRRAVIIIGYAGVMQIFQELFFRGALFTPLARVHATTVVVFATAAYEILGLARTPSHVALWLPLIASLAWLRGRTNSVVPSVLVRISFFGVQCVPIALGFELPRVPKNLVAASVAIVVVALAGIAFLTRRREQH